MQANRSLNIDEIRTYKIESSSEASFTFYNSQQCLEKFTKQFEFPIDLEQEIKIIDNLAEAIFWQVIPVKKFMEVIQKHIGNAASVVNGFRDLIPEGRDKNSYACTLKHINRRVENVMQRKFSTEYEEARAFQIDLSSINNGLEICKLIINRALKVFKQDFALNLEAIKFEMYILQLDRLLTAAFEYVGIEKSKSLTFLNVQEKQKQLKTDKLEFWNCTLY